MVWRWSLILDLTGVAGFTIEQKLLEELQMIYAVIHLANIRTDGLHGPQMVGPDGKVVLPDGMLFGKRRGGIEIKAKSKANLYRIWDRYEHGIDKDKFIAYCAFSAQTQIPVYILIAELKTGDILMADLDTLRSAGRPRPGHWEDGTPNVNWDRHVFTKVGSLSIPNGDLRKMSVVWDFEALDSLISQLSFDLVGG